MSEVGSGATGSGNHTKAGGAASPRIVEAAQRQAEAVKLRAEGHTYQEIADSLDYAGPEGARKAVLAGLKRALEEPSQEVRTLELERLDRLWKRWYALATDETVDSERSLEATDRCLKISAARRNLLGIDSAKKLEVGAPGSFSFAQLIGLARKGTTPESPEPEPGAEPEPAE